MLLHVDKWAELLPRAQVRGLSLNTIFFHERGDLPAVFGRVPRKDLSPDLAFSAPVDAEHVRAGVYTRMNCSAGVPAACLAAQRARGGDQRSCILPEVAAKTIVTPTVCVRSRFDTWELQQTMAIDGVYPRLRRLEFSTEETQRANRQGRWVEQLLAGSVRENSNLAYRLHSKVCHTEEGSEWNSTYRPALEGLWEPKWSDGGLRAIPPETAKSFPDGGFCDPPEHASSRVAAHPGWCLVAFLALALITAADYE